MTSRAILQVFENYQQARTTFVQTIAELASRPQNIEALQNAGVMALLRPLLLDTVPSIQQSAALALGRLANYSEALAEAVVMNEVLPQLVYSLSDQNVRSLCELRRLICSAFGLNNVSFQNASHPFRLTYWPPFFYSQRFYKKAAAFVLRAVAKHSPELSQNVVAAGALDPLVGCLSEFEPSVKEAAVWALSHIARHNADLAQGVVDAGAIAQLVLCLQEPELALRRISASALSELAKHSPEVSSL